MVCRDERELELVKKAAERSKLNGTRVLRDHLWPIKIDNVCARTVLRPDGTIKDTIVAALEEENGVKIAKLNWLSRRDMADKDDLNYYIVSEDH